MTIEYKDSKRIVALSTDVANTPTVNDDLITDKGWDTQGHVGMTYDATNDEVDFNCVADTSHDYALIDLQDADYINGSNISDTAFELKCGWRVDTISNPSANENRATIGLYANNTSNNTAQDIFTLRFSATTGGGQALEMFAKDNAIAVGGSAEYTFTETLSAQTLYLRFNRDGNNFRIRLYSDSNYTTLVEDSGNQSVSGITGLRYFGIKNRGDTQNNGGSTTGAILPNIEIYDGISSTTNKPTDVQDNSLLVEKDTARRYWRTPASSLETESTGSYTWDGITASADNNKQGFHVATTSSAVYGKTINSVSFWLKRQSNTTGTAYCRVWSNANSGGTGGQVHEFGSIALSALTTDYVKYTFSTGSHTLALYDTVGMEFTGSTSDGIIMQGSLSDVYDSTDTIRGRTTNGNGTLSPFSGHDMRFAITETIPATWTMQPTFEDDFSSDNFTQTGTEIDVSGGELVWDAQPDGTTTGGYIDFGENLSDTAWVCRFKVQVNNYSGAVTTATNFFIQLQSITTVDSTTSRDSMGIHLRLKSGNTDWRVEAVDGSVAGGGAGNLIDGSATTETIYVQMYRDGNTIYAEWYDNADYTGTPTNTANHSSGTPANLRYFAVYRRSDTTTTGVSNGIIDDLKIYNGVTSIN